MYPNRIGYAIFGDLRIECLELCADDRSVQSYQFKVLQQYFDYASLLLFLEKNDHWTIARLLGCRHGVNNLATGFRWRVLASPSQSALAIR